MVNENLTDKCRVWVADYCGINQNSPKEYNPIRQTYQRNTPVHILPNRAISTTTGSRFRRRVLKYGLCLTVVVGAGIFCYGRYWTQESRLEVVTNSSNSYVNESQRRLEYFNDVYNNVINLTRQGRLKEADQLSSRLKQEIQDAKK